MQTPTHLLLAFVLLSKKDQPTRNRAVLAGALLPDAFMYICWVWLTWHGISQEKIWNEIYFEAGVQFWDALSNSIPIYGTLAIIGWLTRSKKYGGLLLVFALAALIHMATDFPLHAEDAHQHFWPFSHWRFISPISYWDIRHHGRVVGLVETIFGLGLIVLLLKRFELQSTRIMLYIAFAFYLIPLILRLLFLSGIISR